MSKRNVCPQDQLLTQCRGTIGPQVAQSGRSHLSLAVGWHAVRVCGLSARQGPRARQHVTPMHDALAALQRDTLTSDSDPRRVGSTQETRMVCRVSLACLRHDASARSRSTLERLRRSSVRHQEPGKTRKDCGERLGKTAGACACAALSAHHRHAAPRARRVRAARRASSAVAGVRCEPVSLCGNTAESALNAKTSRVGAGSRAPGVCVWGGGGRGGGGLQARASGEGSNGEGEQASQETCGRSFSSAPPRSRGEGRCGGPAGQVQLGPAGQEQLGRPQAERGATTEGPGPADLYGFLGPYIDRCSIDRCRAAT